MTKGIACESGGLTFSFQHRVNMKIPWIFFLTFMVAINMVATVSAADGSRVQRYEVHTIAPGLYGEYIAKYETRSMIECHSRCTEESACRSMTYDQQERNCSMNTMTANSSMLNSGCVSNCTLTYAEKPCLFNRSCATNSDCEENRRQQCTSGTCVCLTGYSYNESTCDCVTACNTYGSTFAALPGTKLNSDNTRTVKEYTAEICTKRCTTETKFVCKTVEYRASDMNCQMQNYTVLERLSNHVPDGRYVLYVRNCG